MLITYLYKDYVFYADMSVDPKVGSMIPEDPSTKCHIGSMI